MNLEKLSYWIGLAQADGYFKKQKISKNGKSCTKYSLVLSQREDKENIVIKFRDIFNELFQRNNNCICTYKNMKIVNLSVTSLLKFFESNDIIFSDPPRPPKWIKSNKYLFGAYLGGVIDGDGDIRISRKEYPYCAIRITSGEKQEELINSIKENFCCNVNSRKLSRTSQIDNRKIIGNYSILEFYISSKNKRLIQKYLLPHISVKYKKEAIEQFLKKRKYKKKPAKTWGKSFQCAYQNIFSHKSVITSLKLSLYSNYNNFTISRNR